VAKHITRNANTPNPDKSTQDIKERKAPPVHIRHTRYKRSKGSNEWKETGQHDGDAAKAFVKSMGLVVGVAIEPTRGGVQQTLTDFITKNKTAYLGDRLKGEWILAAARSGDFVTVRELGDVLNPNPQILCSQLEARHMGGQRASAAEAIKVFAPFGTCLKLFDQLVADMCDNDYKLAKYERNQP
jgi:hypothetical protein